MKSTSLPKLDQELSYCASTHIRRRFLAVFASLALFSMVCTLLFNSARAQVCTDPTGTSSDTACYVQYRVSYANLSKCAFQEYTNADPPRVHLYHHQVTAEEYHVHTNDSGFTAYTVVTIDCGGGITRDQFIDPGNYSKPYDEDKTSGRTEDMVGANCSYSQTYSGTWNMTSSDTDGRHRWGTTCGNVSYCYNSTYTYQQTLLSVSNDIVNQTWVWAGTDQNIGDTKYCNNTEDTNNTTQGISRPLAVPDLGGATQTALQQTFMKFELNPSSLGYYTYTLTNEYTDDELRGYILAKMPGYSGDWYVPSEADNQLFLQIAYSVIDGSHVSASCWWWPQAAELQKMQYQFVLPNAEAGPEYYITWDEVTWDTTTGNITTLSKSCTAPGGGNPGSPSLSPPQEAMPPYWDDSRNPCGGFVLTWVDNIKVTRNIASVASSKTAVAGSGPYFGSLTGSDSGCSTCGNNSTGGLDNNRWGGFLAEFSMGQSMQGYAAGNLRIFSVLPSTTLATPAALSYAGSDSYVEVVNVSGQIRQVKAPQVLADIVTLDAYSYEIRYYLASQVGSKVSGVYQVSGSAFVTWKVQNPDSSPTIYNRMRLTETRGAAVNVYDWTYTAASGSWKLDFPGSVSELEWVVGTVTNGTSVSLDKAGTLPGYIRTVTATARVPGGADQMKVKRVYQRFNWGEGLTEETFSPNSNPQTTTYTYNDSGNPRHGAPIQSVIHPDGSWQYYHYDTSGRPTRVFSTLGNNPTPAEDAGQRETDYFYGGQITCGDDGTIRPDAARLVVDFVNGNEVSRQYTSFPSTDMRIDIQTTTGPNANWNDPNNLYTTNRFYTSGANIYRLKSVVRPDGTLQTFDYRVDATGNFTTNMTATGQPDSTFTRVIDGTTNWTVLNNAGQPMFSASKDIVSGVVLSQSTYGNFDTLGRPQLVTYLDGTSESTQYACCGVDNTTDRDGVLTSYLYDPAKRPLGQTRLSITITNLLDSAGHVLKTVRVGTDASVIVQNQFGYDLAGRLAKETNALGGITSYAYTIKASTGERSRTVTYADGGTRTETNNADGTLQSVTGTATQPARYEYGIETADTGDSADSYRPYTKEIKLNANGSDSSEWTKTYTDQAGRTYKTMYSDSTPADLTDNPYTKAFYSLKGQLWKQRDADGVVTLYQYNAKGEVEYTGIDVNQDDTLVTASLDRVTRTVSDVTTDFGVNVRRTQTYIYPTDNSGTALLIGKAETSVDGLRSWQTAYRDSNTPVVSQSQTVYVGGGNRYQTNTAPDGSYTLSAYLNGRLVSSTRKDSGNNQISSVTYIYDAHGRQKTATDARNGVTTFGFNAADLLTSTTTPDPAVPGGSAQTIATYYNQMLQATNIINPDGTGITNRYSLAGMLTNTAGSRTYPVYYIYDSQGRMKTMTTWTNYASNLGATVTTWNYDPYRGWLANKRYADNTGADYDYTPGGRLKTRTWARTGTGARIVTTYSYGLSGASSNDHGDLIGVTYSNDPQSTPALTYTYDRRGRQRTIAQGGTTTTLTYNDANEQLTEGYSGGTLGGMSVTNGFDPYLRRTNLSIINSSSTVLVKTAYGYDPASRLQSVTDNSGATAYSANYTYLANSPLVSQILFKQSGTTRMTTSKAYDYLNRLLVVSNAPTAASSVVFNYSYNNANQRIRTTQADGSYWSYEYDSLGQVKTGKKYWNDQTPVGGQQFEYTYDDIGNRRTAKAGGDNTGASLRFASYTPNNLNQYTSRDVPGAVDVMGIELATNTVTVNSSNPYRKGEYYRKEVSVVNASVPVWQSVTVSAPNETTVSGNVFVPKTQEAFGYDLDGNLTSDGRWNYTWDAENRLVSLVANTAVGPQQSVKFEYDSKGRRIGKKIWNNLTFNGTPTLEQKFLYDGWNLIGILNSSFALQTSFYWGLDLSGSVQGAGGIGGLTEINDSVNGVQFVGFDGSGNVSGLIKGADGTISARYEYGPFGELLRATGSLAKSNPLRFSTKYHDDETDLLYFGYRYYNPSTGRWINLDPKGQKGGPNLYAYVLNSPICHIDSLGLETTRTGGTEALKADVFFFKTGSKIGTVQVWTEATTGPSSTHSIWIQFNKTSSDLNCKWVQFVKNRAFDENDKELDDDVPVGVFGRFLRKTKTWYADIDINRSSAWYEPSISGGDTESIWDEPQKNAKYHKMIMEFQSCLLCRSSNCKATDPYLPAFKVTWLRTFPFLDVAPYTLEKGESISTMPEGFQGREWVSGIEKSGNEMKVKSPIFYGD
jgi:RHS repeat-associated protein